MILEAMYNNQKVKISYSRYESTKANEFTGCPYCLKLHNRRWYAVMSVMSKKTNEQEQLVFSIDRIRQAEILEKRFTIPEDFCAAEIFRDCYGVVVGDGTEAQTIRLRAFGRERFGLKDLPIHHSQRLINEQEDYADFEVRLKPTGDFKAFILSKGKWLKVLQPESLAKEIKQLHEESIAVYDNFL